MRRSRRGRASGLRSAVVKVLMAAMSVTAVRAALAEAGNRL
jgi:hypothetical protein